MNLISNLEDLIAESVVSLRNQQEEWFRSMGVETEDDARLLAKHWAIEEGPVKLVDTEDGGKAFTQTFKLVRRVPEVGLVP